MDSQNKFDQEENTSPCLAEIEAVAEPQLTDGQEAKKRLPLFAKIIYAVAAFSAVLYLLFIVSPGFADFFNRYIASIWRALAAKLTGWIPFSLAEFFIILSPLIIFLLVRYGLKTAANSWRDVMIYCATMCCIAAIAFSTFTFTLAAAYRGSTLAEKLELEGGGATAEELEEATGFYASMVAEASRDIVYDADGFSVMPYDYREMNRRLIEAYDKACDKYEFIQRLDSNIKPVMLSGLMSYTHITGVYTFFTGEANINVAFPDYTIPFTAAHELAHQRGIAREDEANFVAFLVCVESEDPYIRYSGIMNLYEYMGNALYRTDSEAYIRNLKKLPIPVLGEMAAYSEFFEKYSDSAAADVSDVINNTFLTIQGTEGIKSYGMVVDLAVSYYSEELKQLK